MKIKLIPYNGYYLGISEDSLFTDKKELAYKHNVKNQVFLHFKTENTWYNDAFKIICASEELNLDVPILPNYKQFEIQKLAENYAKDSEELDPPYSIGLFCGFVEGYNQNIKEFTEEDLRKAMIKCTIENWQNFSLLKTKEWIENYIESLKKLPNIIIESEEISYDDIEKELGIYGHDEGLTESEYLDYKKKNSLIRPVLERTLNNKETVIIKELY